VGLFKSAARPCDPGGEKGTLNKKIVRVVSDKKSTWKLEIGSDGFSLSIKVPLNRFLKWVSFASLILGLTVKVLYQLAKIILTTGK
jgi:hypothetical protein